LGNIIGEQKGVLREILELDSGFLDSLLEHRALSPDHVSQIAQTLYNKNDKLLDILLNRYTGDYSEVMDCLTETGQQHVVNYIYAAGGMCLILKLLLISFFCHLFEVNFCT
jgi:VIT1/CCC1 family predicted Fe2+/Mn2+ transporter